MPEIQRRLAEMRGRADQPGFVRAYIAANGFQFWVALAAAIAGITYLVDPSIVKQSAVAVQVKGLLPFWEALYLAGGAMTVAGMLLCRHEWGWRLEVAGLCLLGAAVITNGAAVITFRNLVGVTTALTFIGLALASAGRIYALLKFAGIGRAEEDE